MNSINWSEKEIAYIKDNYKTLGPKSCSEKLNRTIRACKEKAKQLNIKFDRAYKYDEESLIKIVEKCKSKSECIKELGMKPNPGNYDTLNRYLKKYNISILHFNNSTKYLNEYIKNFVKINMSEILVVNSSYTNRTKLKERLYKEGYKERKCELCGQSEIWKGKKMSLILDHINGINDDNRIENLRIVCPNCNSTLDTHCRGSKFEYNNEKRIEHDINHNLCACGEIKWKSSKTCNKCRGLSQRKIKDRPDKKILLKELETNNYVQVGKKYGVSDNTIRKWIK